MTQVLQMIYEREVLTKCSVNDGNNIDRAHEVLRNYFYLMGWSLSRTIICPGHTCAKSDTFLIERCHYTFYV